MDLLLIQVNLTNTPFNFQSSINVWIINSGVSNYIIGNLKLFNTYEPCQERTSIKIANRAFIKGSWKLIVCLSKIIESNPKFYVRELSCNLSLTSKLTQILRVRAKFDSIVVNVRELYSGRQLSMLRSPQGSISLKVIILKNLLSSNSPVLALVMIVQQCYNIIN